MTDKNIFDHRDTLDRLNDNSPLSDKLSFLHQAVCKQFDFIDRIAVALHDSKTDTLKTYTHSTEGDNPLPMYEAKLSDAPSLKEIIEKGRPRLVQDLAIFKQSPGEHAKKISEKGFKSSYTMPMYQDGDFFGFLFFNSYQANPFNEDTLHALDLFGHLISLVVINELSTIKTLLASVQAARDMTHHRDVETGAHVDRTAHYARIIAREVADKHNFSDDYIEHIFMFSPLHDIGKIGVPDSVLHKPGKLTEQEFEVMKTHAAKGRQIIDAMLKDFGLSSFQYVDILRNIAEFHHEAMDGSGYPKGLKGEEIPIEARISAVADVFDALTSQRPYKQAWSNEEAFATLERLAGHKLDKDCVVALARNVEKVLEIQERFQEDLLG